MQRIAIANSKGGVGKTTTAVCLAGTLAERGHRVLLIDLDPQASASIWLGVPNDGTELLGALLEKDQPLVSLIRQLPAGFDFIPSGLELTRFDAATATRPGRDLIVRRVLSRLPAQWDYVFIDTPGAFGFLAVCALAAADYFLLPIEAAMLSTEPLLTMFQTIEQVRDALNADLRCAGVIACRLKVTANNPKEMLALLRDHFGSDLCETVIHDNIALAEVPAHRTHIARYMPKSRGADDYRKLAEEFERRVGERRQTALPSRHGLEVANG